MPEPSSKISAAIGMQLDSHSIRSQRSETRNRIPAKSDSISDTLETSDRESLPNVLNGKRIDRGRSAQDGQHHDDSPGNRLDLLG